MITRRSLLLGLGALPLAACGASPEKRAVVGEVEIAELTAAIMALGPDIDPEEAGRAARISFAHTRELAIAYEITDPPLIHNTKVNLGIKPRGLCWHWAEDMEKRLNAEGFETLDMNRAISAGHPYRIDHSTAVISAKGETYAEGLVLDPWRLGGVLFFETVAADTRYNWRAREVALAERKAKNEAEAGFRTN